MMKRQVAAIALIFLFGLQCAKGTPRWLIPRSAMKLSATVYMRPIKRGDGPFARCGQLYGFDAHEIGIISKSDSTEDHLMLRRDQLGPDWQALMLSMREGDSVRAWLNVRGTDKFQEYEVYLARVDRLDATGRGMPEIHDSICK
jgi:hypothetical protein